MLIIPRNSPTAKSKWSSNTATTKQPLFGWEQQTIQPLWPNASAISTTSTLMWSQPWRVTFVRCRWTASARRSRSSKSRRTATSRTSKTTTGPTCLGAGPSRMRRWTIPACSRWAGAKPTSPMWWLIRIVRGITFFRGCTKIPRRRGSRRTTNLREVITVAWVWTSRGRISLWMRAPFRVVCKFMKKIRNSSQKYRSRMSTCLRSNSRKNLRGAPSNLR